MKLPILFMFLVILVNVESRKKKNIPLGDSSQNFTFDILKIIQLTENNEDNQLISPISIQTILALLQTGSIGKSLNELSTNLYLPKNISRLNKIFKQYSKLINNSKIDLTSANNIYVAKKYQLPKQLENSAKLFNAEIQKINPGNPEKTVNEINEWVANKTNNKIRDIVDNDSINEDTMMVLINALYFNAQWKYPFNDELTHKRNFKINQNRQIKTDMMILTTNLNYTNSKTINAKILELPYEDEDYVMDIILPNEQTEIETLIKNMHLVFREFKTLNDNEDISVTLPKFQFQYEIALNDVLKKMGLNSIFNKLELKEQINSNLKVTKVKQKTFIDVNEKGSEAAAATDLEIEDRMGGFDRIYFVADHPFIFVIRHKPSGVVFFTGVYRKPENNL